MSHQTNAHELVQLERDLQNAVRHQDRNALEALVGAEYTLTSPRMNVGRAQWIALATGPFVTESFEFLDTRVRQYGEVAIVDARTRQRARLGDTLAESEWRNTDIWVRRHGHWQIVKRHASNVEPEIDTATLLGPPSVEPTGP